MDELEAALGSDMTDVDEVIEALRLDCNTADALLRADFGAADETLANRISALEAASEAADIALNAAIEEVRQRLENVKTELEEENAALSDRLEAEINENGTFRDSVLKLVPVFIANIVRGAGISADNSCVRGALSQKGGAFEKYHKTPRLN